MKLQAFFWAALGALGSVVVVGSGCSSGTNTVLPAPPAKCETAKCAKGNECIEEKGETKCRLLCLAQRTSGTVQGCPANFNCVAPEPGKGAAFYCQAGKQLVKTPGEKQWGAPCNPTGGKEANPDCDSTNLFWCFGTAPTDAQAYCTRYNCADDSDCPAEFACVDVNSKPDVVDAKRGAIGATVKVCKRREFCNSCKLDIDCPPDSNGRLQACLDLNGEKFCAPACSRDTNCPNEGRCNATLGYCEHRAGTCKISGELCSRCESDKDCKNGGACTKDDYSTEKFCTSLPASCADCPKTVGDAHQGSCINQASDPLKGHCVGVFLLNGQPAGIGCYTPNRK